MGGSPEAQRPRWPARRFCHSWRPSASGSRRRPAVHEDASWSTDESVRPVLSPHRVRLRFLRGRRNVYAGELEVLPPAHPVECGSLLQAERSIPASHENELRYESESRPGVSRPRGSWHKSRSAAPSCAPPVLVIADEHRRDGPPAERAYVAATACPLAARVVRSIQRRRCEWREPLLTKRTCAHALFRTEPQSRFRPCCQKGP